MLGVSSRLLTEIGWAGAATVGAAVIAAASAAADPSILQVVVEQYGPFGLVVFILYRRMDDLEERLGELRSDVDDHHNDSGGSGSGSD